MLRAMNLVVKRATLVQIVNFFVIRALVSLGDPRNEVYDLLHHTARLINWPPKRLCFAIARALVPWWDISKSRGPILMKCLGDWDRESDVGVFLKDSSTLEERGPNVPRSSVFLSKLFKMFGKWRLADSFISISAFDLLVSSTLMALAGVCALPTSFTCLWQYIRTEKPCCLR